MSPFAALRGLSVLVLFGTALGARRQRAPAPPRVDDDRPRGERVSTRRLRALAAAGEDLRPYELRRAHLRRLPLEHLDLRGADLTGATLSKSNLAGARLSGCVLDHADLSGADLRGADLRRASLLETELTNADLRGADLSGCRQASMAHFRGARYDRSTLWPAGLDARTTGATLDHLSPRTR